MISEASTTPKTLATAASPIRSLEQELGRPCTLSILIPVYNERATVSLIVAQVLRSETGMERELVIVDDYSTDGTRDILRQIEEDVRAANNGVSVKLVFHERNQGKGAALRTGIRHVSGDIVVIQDADLEYDPQDYPRLLQPILDGRADVVFGNRFHGGPHRVLYFWHYQANRFLTLVSNMLTNLNLSDMEVGYKVFRREAIQAVKLHSNRFGFEPEITVKSAKMGCRIYEVPIAYHGRTYAEGKKIGWKDGVAALYHLLKYRFFD